MMVFCPYRNQCCVDIVCMHKEPHEPNGNCNRHRNGCFEFPFSHPLQCVPVNFIAVEREINEFNWIPVRTGAILVRDEQQENRNE